MINDILNALMLVFFVLGVFTVIYELVMHVLKPSKGEKYSVVVFIDTYSAEVSDRLYAHLMRIDLRGESENACVIAVDTGMSEDEKKMCRAFCNETKNIFLCEPSRLYAVIECLQKENKDGLSAK